ncbi:MAG: type IV pilus twitching motility protein PilT [Planctomycetes bacterium]|nr:type IV pilus twitching motility protein PilT [Planctomycetota bacterium]
MGGTATSRKPPQPPVAAPPHPPAHAQPPGPAPAPVARHATTGPDTSRLPRPASAAPSVRGPAIAPAPATAPAPAPATATATAPTEGQPPPPPAPEQAAAALADTLARGPVDPNRLVALLEAARRLGASDLHLQAGCKPFVRLQGEIVFLNVPPLTPQDTENLCRTALPAEKKSEFFHEQDLDFCYIADGLGRYRANLLRDAYGFGLVFRVISSKVPTLEELGLPSIVAKFTTYSQGLVLITGPSGCGKSSTMAALIDTINRDRKEHIITVEEPIEFVMTSRRCLINQREIPRDSRSYGQALRAALREDPDIIMIGELRDLETISLAITAAETGHLVLSTLHTRNATSTVDRLIDVFPPIQQPQIRAMLSVSLRGVLTQQLVRTADGRRRVAVTELLFNTPAIGNLIRDSRTFQLRSQMQTGRKLGMRLMDTSLTELVRAGVITAEAARPLAEAKAEL